MILTFDIFCDSFAPQKVDSHIDNSLVIVGYKYPSYVGFKTSDYKSASISCLIYELCFVPPSLLCADSGASFVQLPLAERSNV